MTKFAEELAQRTKDARERIELLRQKTEEEDSMLMVRNIRKDALGVAEMGGNSLRKVELLRSANPQTVKKIVTEELGLSCYIRTPNSHETYLDITW